MKILKVIVDELPVSASQCRAVIVRWEKPNYEKVGCRFRDNFWHMTLQEFTAERCPDCPLALEHDNKKIANEVM